MAPNFQSSFIPKGPLTTEKAFEKKKGSIFGSLMVVLFILTIAATGGLYMYKQILVGDIESLKSKLVEAEQSIDTQSIKRMYEFSQKLSTAKSIVSNHMIVSDAMALLASSTVRSVTFSEFTFDTRGNIFLMNVKGTAGSYASVALQEDVLRKSTNVRSVTISNLTLSEKGQVTFDMALALDAAILRYNPPLPPVMNTPVGPTSTTTATTTSADSSADDLSAALNDFDLPDTSFNNL